MRAFIAIELDPELKKTLQELILDLKRKGANVRWIKPGGMHLTLKFLGEIDEDIVPEIKETLRKVVSESQSFPLVFSGTGFFPNERRPRILWIGLDEQPLLMTLQSALESKMESLGFLSEKRPFHPHLTLGRVKNTANLQRTLEKLKAEKETAFGEMKAEKITLFQSILKPEGAEYRVISEFPLT